MKTITQDKMTDEVRDVVLAALDDYMRVKLDHNDARGWIDSELRTLFAGVDAHAKAMAARINGGMEPGSAGLTITDE